MFNKLIRNRRLELNISQQYIADEFGFTSSQFISNFERGLCDFPLSKLNKLCKILSLDKKIVLRTLLRDRKKELENILN